jgi:arylformamidase
MAMRGVRMIGIDTPSVDHIESKNLETHHQLLERDMLWLENLDLTQVSEGEYFLVALPLKFMELEASPVRAILLTDSPKR